MLIDSVLTSGLEFEDSEEYLAFRFRFFNAVMLTSMAFSLLFIGLSLAGVNDLGVPQLIATMLHSVSTLILMLLLRGHKHYFPPLSAIFVVQCLAVFTSALVFVESDELRIIWFFIHMWVVYILMGQRIGTWNALAVISVFLTVNQYLSHPFSSQAVTTVLIGLLVTAVISYAYATRSISYFDRLTQSNAMLRELASKDPLTGILNPSAYYEVANRMIRLAHRAHDSYAVLFIDLDHFKHINDQCGHETGDAVLRAVAACLACYIRESDILGRIGGEEFSVFLPGTDLDGAAHLAEKLRESLERLTPLELEGQQLRVTASIGAVQNLPGDECIADILRRADKAMYAAKTRGRNQVVAIHGNSLRHTSTVLACDQDTGLMLAPNASSQ